MALSVDHEISKYYADNKEFIKSINISREAALKGKIVTFGIEPTNPETGYGYIKSFKSFEEDNLKTYKIEQFIEKPNKLLAEEFCKDKRFSWNSGIFVAKASTILEEVEKYSPEILNLCRKSINNKTFDDESRFIRFDYKSISIISLYVPSGSSSEKRLSMKFEFMNFFTNILKELITSGRKVIICGDFNVAHKEIDLKNWKTNQKNSGFLPEEREWFSRILKMGFLDVFREIVNDSGHYTWWSNRANAYANNVGWRIDYQIATKNIQNKILSSKIIKEPRFSDHAILEATYDINF